MSVIEDLAYVRDSAATAGSTAHLFARAVANSINEDLESARELFQIQRRITIVTTTSANLDGPKGTSVTASCDDCAICQETNANAASRINVCGHTFHTACIRPWLDRNPTCPMCRAAVA